MTDGTPPHDETSQLPTEKPRKPFRLTGARLGGNKVQLAQILLRRGDLQCKVAKDLSISRRSVGAIAKRMREESYAAPSGAQQEQDFDAFVKGDLRRVAKLSLQNITPEKAEQANIHDLSRVAQQSLTRLDVMEGQGANRSWYGQFLSDLGAQPSHSVSRVTLEQKVTLETQHKPHGLDQGQ